MVDTVQQPQPVDSGISINDLSLVVQIFNLASRRGAFQANELSEVGAVFDKINALVTRAQEDAKQKEEALKAAQEAAAQPEVSDG